MSGYKYQEPKPVEFEVLPVGEYDFTVVAVEEPYTKSDTGGFVFPVIIQIKNTQVKVYDYPGAGLSKKDRKPYDTVAPFLKAIRRNPAVDEEPDFSAAHIVGAKGRVKLKVEDYQGVKNNKVAYYIYDRDQAAATISRPGAGPVAYNKSEPAAGLGRVEDDNGDNIPF